MKTQVLTRNTARPLGPPRYLRLAHFLRWRPDTLGFLLDSAAKYGDVIDLSLGPTTYLLNNSEDIRHVLTHSHRLYAKTRRLTSARGRHLSGEGLLTSSGEAALTQRRILQPIALPASHDGFSEIVLSCTQESLAGWHPGTVYDMADEMIRLTQRIIGKILFSVDLSGEARALAEAIGVRQRYIHYAFKALFPIPESIPTQRNREHRQALQCLLRFLDDAILARRSSVAPPRDMLSMIIESRYKDGTAMSDRLVRDEALTLISTGFETVGAGLAWCCHLLAQNPAEQEELHAELHTVLGDRAPRVEDLPRLRYTTAVFRESLRLYPPTWIFVRVAQQDDVLSSGVRIRSGAKLFLCPYVTHRNPAYFPDPERFDPGRFSEAAEKARPRFAYFPFSGGPRVCLGQAFAEIESILILASLEQRFRLEPTPGRVVVPDPGQMLFAKGGIPVTLTRREPASAN